MSATLPSGATGRVLGFELGRVGGATVTVGGLAALALGLVLAAVVARLAGAASARVLERRGVGRGTRDAVVRIVRYSVATIAILVALSSAGIDIGAILAASTVALVGIGLGFQRLAQDFLAGFVLLLDRSVSKGDFVRVGESVGTVEEVGARTTRIVTRDKVTLIVPNSELTSSIVVNFSQPTEAFRTLIRFGVAYGTPPERVRAVAEGVARASGHVLASPPAEVFFDDFGDSALIFSLSIFVADPREDRRIASRLRFELAKAFASAGISVPFPQLDVHVRRDPPTSD